MQDSSELRGLCILFAAVAMLSAMLGLVPDKGGLSMKAKSPKE